MSNNLVKAAYEQEDLNLEQREACKNLVTTLITGTTAALGGEAAVATTAATLESENNELISGTALAAIGGTLYLADKALTAYQLHQDIKALRSGEKTLEQIALERGEQYIIGILVGNLAGYGYKACKNFGGKWVLERLSRRVVPVPFATVGRNLNKNSATITGRKVVSEAVIKDTHSIGKTAYSATSARRLSLQLAAEKKAGARIPVKIVGYSKHALNRIIARDKAGVGTGAVLDAWKHPLNITYHPTKYGPAFRFKGKSATIVINCKGELFTAWAHYSMGARLP